MPQVVNHGGRDAWILSSSPSDNHGDSPYLRMAGTDHYALERLQYTVPKGATVTSATLELHARGAFPAQTVTAQRCSDSWGDQHVTWNSQPGVTGTAKSVTLGAALADGDLISIDVTAHVQSVASGAKNYGWRLSVSGTSVVKVYGLDAGQYQPRLVLEYADKPGVPTDLVPGDGSVVSDPAPTVRFSYVDVTGEGMGSLQVQCDPAGNATAPAFDSGEVTATEPELDLSSTTFTALAAGGSTQWRVRAKGNDGAWSDWSEWAQFTYQPQVVITPSSPSTTTPTVLEPTPPIQWTTDKNMSAAEVRITKQDDHTHVLYTSHRVKMSGTTGSITIPKKWRGNRVLRDDTGYALNIRVWDTETAREATPGHPTFGYTWLDFTADTDAAVTAPDTLTAAQQGGTPFITLTWTRSTAPDSFVVRMDGHVIESGILPADVLVSGTQYQWTYQGAAPLTAHTFHVRAVVNGHSSPNSPAATITTEPQGVWLLDTDRGLSFVLGGRGVDSWAMTDQVSTYRRMDGTPLQIHTGMSGLEGHFDGTLGYSQRDPSRTVAQLEADLYSIKEHPETTLQLIAGDFSIPVCLRNLSDGPAPNTLPGNPRRLVSFDFFQNGDLPFDVRL